MHLLPRLLIAAVLLLATSLLAQAQALPYDKSLVEPDQELDDFSGGYQGLHVISPRLRGVMGSEATVYWVSADGQQLTAYRAGQPLWRTDVVAAFKPAIPAAHIRSVVLTSHVLLVSLAKRGFAELDRQTGAITSKRFD